MPIRPVTVVESRPTPTLSPHPIASPPRAPPPPPDAATPSPFAQLVRGLGREIQTSEAAVHGALRASDGGAVLGDRALIALQVGVYRHSEAVDLAAKLVDRAQGAVKTVLQGQ